MTARNNVISLKSVPEKVLLVSFLSIAVLGILHAVTNLCWTTHSCGTLGVIVDGVGYLFDFNAESNVPNWFSTVLLVLVCCSTVPIFLFHLQNRLQAIPWGGLALLFAYMSLDEATDLHGLLVKLVPRSEELGFSSSFFAWVIPGSFIALTIALLFSRWLFTLPRRTRNLFMIAGCIYVFGGLVLEAVGGQIADKTFLNAPYLIVSTLEETLEMVGASLMLYAVVDHARMLRIVLSFGSSVSMPYQRHVDGGRRQVDRDEC